MSSKIAKQKQIYSLLSSKFGNLLEPTEQAGEATFNAVLEKVPQEYPGLLDKVYNFYRSIIQNINSGLMTVDLSGEITFANKWAAQLLGYPLKELMGLHLEEILLDTPESEKLLRTLFLPGKRIDDREVGFRTKKGTELTVGLSSSTLRDENNEFNGIVLLFRDLTEIRHLQKQLERMERLALLGELSAGIAHEIRNPLAGIKASAQILEESFGQDDFRLQMVRRIIREVDKSNRLLKEFFKFAKPTRPKLKFSDVEMIIDGVYLLLAPKFQKRNIQFITDFSAETPQIYVDETQIEQVVLNLFLNAIDAMPNGGKLSVRTMPKKLRILDAEQEKLDVMDNELQYVILEITDTGQGIAAKDLEKIFNPFFTTKNEGVGLGLSICSRLIEENGGKIDVASKVNVGTTFVLALPAFIHK
ncbi:MAG: nitrogen fixation sensor histidine kinase GnfL [Calditrichia bacterium]